jgi:hypothetical protein
MLRQEEEEVSRNGMSWYVEVDVIGCKIREEQEGGRKKKRRRREASRRINPIN